MYDSQAVREKPIKEQVIRQCWTYLRDNFHKFSETNKIKVALALAQKDIPQKMEGMNQSIVVMNDIKRNNDPLRFDIGNDAVSCAVESTGEVVSGDRPSE